MSSKLSKSFEPEWIYQKRETTPAFLQVHEEQEAITGQTHEAGIIDIVGDILWKLKDDAVTAKCSIFRNGQNHIHVLDTLKLWDACRHS